MQATMEEELNYAFNLSIENENVEKAFNMLDSEGGLCYPALP